MELPGRRRASPALVIAVIAMFVTLCGSAGAVVTATVPLAKRALVADRAKVANTAKTANTAKVANKAKTATTATTAAVAQNALTFEGETREALLASAVSGSVSEALAATPPGSRPATSVTGLLSVKTVQVALGPAEEKEADATCDVGQKAVGGGISSDGAVLGLDTFPLSNGTTWSWRVYLVNLDDTNPVTATVYASCLK